MTQYYKIVENGLIVGIGTNGNDEVAETDEAEYNELLTLFRSAPVAPVGYVYLLRDDPREWVLVELPEEPDPELTDDETLQIILGGGDA